MMPDLSDHAAIDAILERHQGAMTKADYRAAGDDIRRLLAAREADIARLSAELDAAREALAPFAEVAEWAERNSIDLMKGWDMLLRGPDGGFAGHLQVQSPEFIAARAVFAKLSAKEV